jgi:hypothetical protein
MRWRKNLLIVAICLLITATAFPVLAQPTYGVEVRSGGQDIEVHRLQLFYGTVEKWAWGQYDNPDFVAIPTGGSHRWNTSAINPIPDGFGYVIRIGITWYDGSLQGFTEPGTWYDIFTGGDNPPQLMYEQNMPVEPSSFGEVKAVFK